MTTLLLIIVAVELSVILGMVIGKRRQRENLNTTIETIKKTPIEEGEVYKFTSQNK